MNHRAQMTKSLALAGGFRTEPMLLIDVGSSGGILPSFRLYQDQLIAHGIEPQVAEVQRLKDSEMHASVCYHALRVALPEDDAFVRRRSEQAALGARHANPWPRLSTAWAHSKRAAPSQSQATCQPQTTQRIALADFVARQRLPHVDFIKIDTDGCDLEVLVSCREVFRTHDVLGVMIETPFTGSHLDTDNTFHNIDRFLKERGFMMYGLEVCRYTRRDLPGIFKFPILAQTHSGQPIWADIVYLRDGGDAEAYHSFWGKSLTPAKALKLASLYELFGVPDCAAELINAHRAAIAVLADPDVLLDLLTPRLRGRRLSYHNYVNTFETDIARFFPARSIVRGMARRLLRLCRAA